MKYRCAMGIAALSLCLGAAVAQAQYRYYSYFPPDEGFIFRLGIGPSFWQDGQFTQFGGPVSSTVNYDTGLTFDAALGWAFNQYLAVDFETGFIGADIKGVPGYYSNNSSIYNVPFLVNFTLSYPIPHTFLVPYVGAGVGGADVVFDTDFFGPSSNNYVTGSEDDVVFAGQVFAGVRFKLNPNMALDLGYKYFSTGDPTFTYPPDNFNVGFNGAQTHSVLFSIIWKF